jgi:hypothetical protein
VSSNGWNGSRKFRRAVINGRFVLIHEGKEECQNHSGTYLTLTPGSAGNVVFK